MIIHVVRPGDSVYSISRRYGVPMQRILQDNALSADQLLMIGQAILIITDVVRHTVTSGQSLYSIARIYGVTVESILNANPGITNPARINIGQVIIVPVIRPALGSISVNGYAFPNINRNTLANTLPHLTFLSIFSYQVRANGSLVPINDNELINLARQSDVAPLMVITNILEGGSFDSNLAHAILTNQQVQDNLIENVIDVLGKGYRGLDIDFEYIFPEDRVNYINFVTKITQRLHSLGYTVSIALAPKTSATQQGLLYEAHDYEALGRIVDHVILMTYEWGYTYGPAQAVSPLNRVEQVLRYAVTAIPRNKILMGIPNYGYDWTLPFVQGSAARSLSNVAAVRLASDVRAEIKFDPVAQSPFFNYYDSNGRQHVVWFEDPRSIEAKLRLVNKYNIEGVSFWTINSFFPQSWLILESLYNVRKVI